MLLRQPLRRSTVFWTLVVMVVLSIVILAYDRPLGSTVMIVLAVLAAVLAGGVWAVRRTRVRLVDNRIEIHESIHSPRIVTRSAVKVVDAHRGENAVLYSSLDKLGQLPTGWGRVEGERLAQELGVPVCTGPGPDCPRTR